MKWTFLVMVGAFWLVPAVRGQQTGEATAETSVVSRGDFDLASPLFLDDAFPVPEGRLDLRLRLDWLTDDTTDIDGDDDFVIGTSLFYGLTEKMQLSADLPFNIGDGREKDDVRGFGGNGDVTVGMLYQFLDQAEYVPAMAFQTNFSFRTGYRSSPLDMEMRLLMTNEYDSGIRSHINLSLATVTGHFSRWNWEAVIGADGPLCADGAVRWVMDVAHRNSELNNGGNSTYAEIGSEWDMENGHKLGLMGQAGLDDHDQTADFGARVMWVIPLVN